MYSNSISFDWPISSLSTMEIWYHHMDYMMMIWFDSIIIRWTGGWSLTNQYMEWAELKKILSDFIQWEPRIRLGYPNLPRAPIILMDEHAGPNKAGFIIFNKIKGAPEALWVTIKLFVDNILCREVSLILCHPQRDLFKNNTILNNPTLPLIFGTKEEIWFVMDIAQSTYQLQRKFYPDLKI